MGAPASLPRSPLSFPSHQRVPSQPSIPDGEVARVLQGAPPLQGLHAGDLGERAREPFSSTRRARALGSEHPNRDSNTGPVPPTFGQPKASPQPSAPRRLCSSTRAWRGVPGCSRAHPAPNRSWAAGRAPLVRQSQGGEPERSRGPAVRCGRGRRDSRPVTYARALGNPMERSTSSADPCLMVPGRCWRFLRGVTLLYSSSLAAMPSGLGLPY